MNKSIVDLFYELDDKVFCDLVLKRLPDNSKIELVNRKLCEHPQNAYIDVAFTFINSSMPRDAFYTHIYYGDILKDKFLLDVVDVTITNIETGETFLSMDFAKNKQTK